MNGIVMELRPSKEMWDYYFEASWKRKEITPLSVCTAIADKLAGYHISYTANEVLKDLGLLTPKGTPNKLAKEALHTYLHYNFFKSIKPLAIVPPAQSTNVNRTLRS
jgi:hypothetical protein